MYHYIFGFSLLKSVNPYFRKHLLQTLDSHEVLMLNTLFICFFVIIVFIYKTIKKTSENNYTSIAENFNNYKKLSMTQIGALFVMAFITVMSSLSLFELDKNHNTPLLNSLFIKFTSLFLLFLTSTFIFGERYTIKQIFGIIITIIGIYFITQK